MSSMAGGLKKIFCVLIMCHVVGSLSGMEPQGGEISGAKRQSSDELNVVESSKVAFDMVEQPERTWRDSFSGMYQGACSVVTGLGQKVGAVAGLLASGPVDPTILASPWSNDLANVYLEACDYARLDVYLRHYMGKQSVDAFEFTQAQAGLGVVPCCYLDLCNRIKSPASGVILNRADTLALARDILIFLALIQLDIATWYVDAGEAQDGELERIALVYPSFLQKIKNKLGSFAKEASFNAVHDAAFELLREERVIPSKEDETSLVYRPYVWVQHCNAASRVSAIQKISYGVVPESQMQVCTSRTKKARVQEIQRKLLPRITEALRVNGMYTFDQFLNCSRDFGPEWFRSLEDLK